MIHEIIPIQTERSEAQLYTYILDNFPGIDSSRQRPVVIICPGGGYEFTSDREAEPIAVQMNAMGFHACVLRYSVRPATFPTALLELATTINLVRENAKKWNIDPEKVIVAGFSAGGHLAACLGVFWNQDFLGGQLEIPKKMLKPNGLLLSYPVITSGEHAHQGSFDALLGENHTATLEDVSLEKQVTADTPPAFIWHTYTDDAVPVENAFLFASALRRYNIPLEMHIYPEGEHGLALATEETYSTISKFGLQKDCAGWVQLAGTWIRNL